MPSCRDRPGRWLRQPEIESNGISRWKDEVEIPDAQTDMMATKAAGVDTIVDLTAIGLGRNVGRVRTIAEPIGVNVIVGTSRSLVTQVINCGVQLLHGHAAWLVTRRDGDSHHFDSQAGMKRVLVIGVEADMRAAFSQIDALPSTMGGRPRLRSCLAQPASGVRMEARMTQSRVEKTFPPWPEPGEARLAGRRDQEGAGTMAALGSHPNPDALTVDEAASYLRISRAKLAELIARGAVPSYQLGRRRFFLRSVLDDWLRGLATSGPDSAA